MLISADRRPRAVAHRAGGVHHSTGADGVQEPAALRQRGLRRHR